MSHTPGWQRTGEGGSTRQACSRSSGTLPTHLAPGQLHLLMQPLSQDIQCKDRVRCCGLVTCREGAYAERGALPSNHHHFSLSLPQRRLWIYRPQSVSAQLQKQCLLSPCHMTWHVAPDHQEFLCPVGHSAPYHLPSLLVLLSSGDIGL